ncbi:MAG TPA: ATP-binding protein [Actinomycetota bacterium]|nr:ATP-binding protein [Actinomycetota bacterium]
MTRETTAAGKRVVTLDEASPEDLVQVRDRRRHLNAVILLVLVLTAAAVVLFSIASERFFDEPLEFLDLSAVRYGFVALAIMFALYAFARERALSRTEQALMDERVLSAALANRLHELSQVTEAGKAVSTVLSQEQVFQVIMQTARDLLGATESSIMLLDPDAGVLRIAAATGMDETIQREAAIPVGDGVAGWVAESLQPVILKGDVRDPRFKYLSPKSRALRSAMSVPLRTGDRTIGVLNVSVSGSGRDYTEHDLRALTVFAEQAASAISNAQVYERQRAANISLAELDRQRQDFLATLTHDLKTPLTSILGYVKLIRRVGDSISTEQAQMFTDVIERQGKRILEMVERLVEVSKYEEGAPTLTRDKLDLAEIIEDQVMTVRGMMGSRKLELDVPPELPEVYGDRSAVEHILANILENAVKYSPEDGTIDLAVDQSDGEVRVSVTDDGPGIPVSHLETVFNRYHQAGKDSATGSVGLGLYIVKSLATAHGGRAWAENVPDRGAKVSFTLPIRTQ